MSSVVVENVTKQYGDSPAAVKNISFEVPKGTFTVLLGPSGCGKSTTLRMIAGLDTPSSGRIVIDSRDVTDLAPSKRKISMVFQSYALFPHMSVRENILFGLKVRKEPARDFNRRLHNVADLLGLQLLLDRKPSQLSGGQQQRVALGRAVISEAPVCLMDEPLSNLDAKLRHEMRREIRGLQQKLGITMIYVTHDQTEAMSMADHVVLLNQGQVEQHDTPDQLYARPATEFAAGFIGTPPMNLLDLDESGTGLTGCAAALDISGNDQAKKLGIRPEHISIGAANGAVNGVDATVQGVEYFGADTIVVCRVGQNAGVTIRTPGHLRAQSGQAVKLSWQPQQQHFFDTSGHVIAQGPSLL